MKKRIKMVLYGEPSTGKSVFACHAPKPFFFCTDGNYEWLEDWGAKEEDHVQLFSWEQAKNAFHTQDLTNYETIVVDLLEDLFKWCEFEFCKKNKIAHIGDLGYGKGYDITRNEFFIEISKLLSMDKNVILITHGLTLTLKDKRGVEFNKYTFSNRLPDKVADQIEGRVRYFLRAYALTEVGENDKLVTNRYISLQPDGITEYGIIRGLDITKLPRYIPLDWNIFYDLINDPAYKPTILQGETVSDYKENIEKEEPKKPEIKINVTPKQNITNDTLKDLLTKKPQSIKKPTIVNAPNDKITDTDSILNNLADTIDDTVKDIEDTVNLPDDNTIIKESPLPEVKNNEVEENKEEIKKPEVIDTNDRIKALKAKMAALRANK